VPTLNLNGAVISTELLKIKWDVKEDVKHSGSDHPQGISAPSFSTAPLWVVGEVFLNHSNIEAVLNKRQPGDSPWKTKTNNHISTLVNLLLTRRQHKEELSCVLWASFYFSAPSFCTPPLWVFVGRHHHRSWNEKYQPINTWMHTLLQFTFVRSVWLEMSAHMYEHITFHHTKQVGSNGEIEMLNNNLGNVMLRWIIFDTFFRLFPHTSIS